MPDAFQLRIGLNLGDVIVQDDGDVYGEGINVAARLESMADPGGILISGKVHSEVEGKLDFDFKDRGDQQLKNISKPVRIYAVHQAAAAMTFQKAISAAGNSKTLPNPTNPRLRFCRFKT
jgi:adenylate cyclase